MAAFRLPDPPVRHAMRGVALAIAVLAAIDPVITSVRRTTLNIAVVPVDASADSALAFRVAEFLGNRAHVIHGRFARADATVAVGDGVLHSDDGMSSTVFAVRAEHDGPQLRISDIRAPSAAGVQSQVRVGVHVSTRGMGNRPVDVLLRVGDLVMDRVRANPLRDAPTATATLAFVPVAAGLAHLRVEALPADAASASTSASSPAVGARADLTVIVRDAPLPILVYDTRPSWMSTFVRRALERDPRLAVTSRVVMARNISSGAGEAPTRLDNASILSRFDVIVVGAPEQLNARDVVGLESFMRQRGGRVLLLADRQAHGPFEILLGVGAWEYRSEGSASVISSATSDSTVQRASEVLLPAALPDGVTVLASVARDASNARAIIWQRPVGIGAVIMSGALDAWRFRDRSTSSFDLVWQGLVADAASAALPAVDVHLTHDILAPGEFAEVTVAIRDAMIRTPSAAASGERLADGRSDRTTTRSWLEIDSGATTVRQPIDLWPDGLPGMLRGSVQAPDRVGEARIVVTVNGVRSEHPLLVDSVRPRPTPDVVALQRAWIGARRGAVFLSSQLPALESALTRAVGPAERRESWHPMRTAWWLLPFVLALAIEWALRRRRGLA